MSIENYLKKIKDYWLLISIGSFALMIALSVGGYSAVFSGDTEASVEYVQAYVSNGYYKIAVYSILAILLFAVMLFMPAHASLWLFEKWRGQSKRERIFSIVAIYVICIIGALFAGLICTFLSGGYSTDPSAAMYFYIYLPIMAITLVTYFIFLTPILVRLLSIFRIREGRRRRSWTTRFLIALMVVITLWQPANVLSLINGGDDKGYMACVYGDRNINGKSEVFEETVIPLSYDTKGVQVFTGDYNEDVNKWSNIRQEYLYFDQGYSIKRGEKCPE